MLSLAMAAWYGKSFLSLHLPAARQHTHKEFLPIWPSSSRQRPSSISTSTYLSTSTLAQKSIAMATNDAESLYCTGCALTSFHLFPKLPDNLRALVLSQVAPMPRTRFLEVNFSVTHKGGALAHLFATPKPENTFYINFERDIIFLSSRFTPSGKSTETSRLRELSSLLKPALLSQVRKVVVTYSSLHGYEAIGGVLLDYAGLETLYVAMCNWWRIRV